MVGFLTPPDVSNSFIAPSGLWRSARQTATRSGSHRSLASRYATLPARARRRAPQPQGTAAVGPFGWRWRRVWVVGLHALGRGCQDWPLTCTVARTFLVRGCAQEHPYVRQDGGIPMGSGSAPRWGHEEAPDRWRSTGGRRRSGSGVAAGHRAATPQAPLTRALADRMLGVRCGAGTQTPSSRCTGDSTAPAWVHVTDRLAAVDRPGVAEIHGLPAQEPVKPAPVNWTRARTALSAVALVGFQSLLTLATMLTVGLITCVIAGPYDGLLAVLGWLFWSAALAVLTTGVVLVLGLPLRLIPRLRTWWSDNGEYTLLGALVGAGLIASSFLAGSPDAVSVDGVDLPIFQPHWMLLLAGWTVLAFSCAHVRWPRRWTRAILRRMDPGSRGPGTPGETVQS